MRLATCPHTYDSCASSNLSTLIGKYIRLGIRPVLGSARRLTREVNKHVSSVILTDVPSGRVDQGWYRAQPVAGLIAPAEREREKRAGSSRM